MSTSVSLPNTIQIRPSRLTGLVVAVAVLTGVTTWSVSQVTTDGSSNPEAVSTPNAATQAYVDGVVALDAEQRAAIFGNLASTPQSVQSVNAHSPELQAVNVSSTQAIAAMARAEGLTGLSPASLRSPNPQSVPTQQSVQSVNAHSPELQAIDLSPTQAIAAMARAEGLTGLSPASLHSPTQPYADAIAGLPRDQLVALFGTFS